jgi:DNA-binding transcriptional LysR family regulator
MLFPIGSGIESRAVDFRHLRAFITVADEASVTRAAERLHISQPPLSRHIRQLEEELGLQLFIRHHHGVTLTEAGQRLLQKARALDAAASDFFDAAGQVIRNGSQTVRVGVGWGLWESLNRVRVDLSHRPSHPALDVVDIQCADDCNDRLRNHSLDVVFARPPFDTEALHIAPLFQERLLAVLAEEHPLATRKSVWVRELAEEPLLLWDRHLMPAVYDAIVDLYERTQVNAKTIATPGVGPHTHAGLMMVASRKGVYLCIGLPVSSQQPSTGVALVPISDPDACVNICVAWRKKESSPAVLQFLDSVWEVFPQRRVS